LVTTILSGQYYTIHLRLNTTAAGGWNAYENLPSTNFKADLDGLEVFDSQIKFSNAGGYGVNVFADPTLSTTYDWIYPVTAGTAGQILTSGAGSVLTWSNPMTTSSTIATAGGGNIIGTSNPVNTSVTTLTVNGNFAGVGAFRVNSTSVNNLLNSAYLNPSMGNNRNIYIALGRSLTARNSATPQFNYISDASTQNNYSIGLYGLPNSVNIYENGVTATLTGGTLRVSGGTTTSSLYVTGAATANQVIVNNNFFTTTIETVAASNYTFTLPVNIGTAGQYLVSGGVGGATSWTSTALPTTSVLNLTPTGHSLGSSIAGTTLALTNTSDTVSTLKVTNNTATGCLAAEYLAPSLANNYSIRTVMGKDSTTEMNNVEQRFNHISNSNPLNYYSINFTFRSSSLLVYEPDKVATSSSGTLRIEGGISGKDLFVTGKIETQNKVVTPILESGSVTCTGNIVTASGDVNCYRVNTSFLSTGGPYFNYSEGSATPTIWWESTTGGATGSFISSYNSQNFYYTILGRTVNFSLALEVVMNPTAYVELNSIFIDNLPNLPSYFGETTIPCL
jgi:hypothetical protein